MSDYCGWCGVELPLTMREAVLLYRENEMGAKHEARSLCLCGRCREQARREGWKPDDKKERRGQ